MEWLIVCFRFVQGGCRTAGAAAGVAALPATGSRGLRQSPIRHQRRWVWTRTTEEETKYSRVQLASIRWRTHRLLSNSSPFTKRRSSWERNRDRWCLRRNKSRSDAFRRDPAARPVSSPRSLHWPDGWVPSTNHPRPALLVLPDTEVGCRLRSNSQSSNNNNITSTTDPCRRVRERQHPSTRLSRASTRRPALPLRLHRAGHRSLVNCWAAVTLPAAHHLQQQFQPVHLARLPVLVTHLHLVYHPLGTHQWWWWPKYSTNPWKKR